MNAIERFVIWEEVKIMLNKLWAAIDGQKTYLLAGLGIVVSLVGHFTHGVTLPGGVAIPDQSWNQVLQAVYASGIIAAIRHGIEKNNPTPAPKQ